MTEWTASVELDAPVRELTPDRADTIMDTLHDLEPAVGGSTTGHIEILLTIDADTINEALTTLAARVNDLPSHVNAIHITKA